MNDTSVALTMGEPAGIGGEIALKAWLRRGEGLPPFSPSTIRTASAA